MNSRGSEKSILSICCVGQLRSVSVARIEVLIRLLIIQYRLHVTIIKRMFLIQLMTKRILLELLATISMDSIGIDLGNTFKVNVLPHRIPTEEPWVFMRELGILAANQPNEFYLVCGNNFFRHRGLVSPTVYFPSLDVILSKGNWCLYIKFWNKNEPT